MDQSIKYIVCRERNVPAAYERFRIRAPRRRPSSASATGTRTGRFAALRGWLNRAAARAAVERRLR
jgi:hypothetical protein